MIFEQFLVFPLLIVGTIRAGEPFWPNEGHGGHVPSHSAGGQQQQFSAGARGQVQFGKGAQQAAAEQASGRYDHAASLLAASERTSAAAEQAAGKYSASMEGGNKEGAQFAQQAAAKAHQARQQEVHPGHYFNNQHHHQQPNYFGGYHQFGQVAPFGEGHRHGLYDGHQQYGHGGLYGGGPFAHNQHQGAFGFNPEAGRRHSHGFPASHSAEEPQDDGVRAVAIAGPLAVGGPGQHGGHGGPSYGEFGGGRGGNRFGWLLNNRQQPNENFYGGHHRQGGQLSGIGYPGAVAFGSLGEQQQQHHRGYGQYLW